MRRVITVRILRLIISIDEIMDNKRRIFMKRIITIVCALLVAVSGIVGSLVFFKKKKKR